MVMRTIATYASAVWDEAVIGWRVFFAPVVWLWRVAIRCANMWRKV